MGAFSGGGLAALGVATLEALHAPAGVDQLLLARVERVAVRADLHAELGLRGTGLERIATGAVHRGRHVLGMDSLLHDSAFPGETLHCPKRTAIPPQRQGCPPWHRGVSCWHARDRGFTWPDPGPKAAAKRAVTQAQGGSRGGG